MDSIWCQIVSAFQWAWSYDLGKFLLIGLCLLYAYGIAGDISDRHIKIQNKV